MSTAKSSYDVSKLLRSAAEGAEPKTGAVPLYKTNDTGNAQRLVEHHGADFRYVAKQREFIIWDEHRWKFDTDALELTQWLKQTNSLIWEEAQQFSDPEMQKSRAKWAVYSQNTSKLTAAIENVKSEPGVAIDLKQLDADPMLLGVENGVVDLRTGKFRAARQEDFITKSAGCAFDAKAKCPKFRKLLAAMFTPEVVAYFRRVLGYTLTGQTIEQVLFLLLGVAKAGKSVLLETIKAMMGGYAVNARTDLLVAHARTSKGAQSEDEARLAGARLVTVNETVEGMRLNEALIKDLTGGDTVTARAMYKSSAEFLPQFKIFIRGNHKPRFAGDDGAMRRRAKLVWCENAVPEKRRDKNLKKKLMKELPGILNFAVQGCREWQRSGLSEPAGVSSVTEEYLNENDTLGRFIDECCVLQPAAKIGVRKLYKRYEIWITQTGQYPLSEVRFSDKMVERGHKKDRNKHGKTLAGIRFKDPPTDAEIREMSAAGEL
jgi:putative DNA primase/helicase